MYLPINGDSHHYKLRTGLLCPLPTALQRILDETTHPTPFSCSSCWQTWKLQSEKPGSCNSLACNKSSNSCTFSNNFSATVCNAIPCTPALHSSRWCSYPNRDRSVHRHLTLFPRKLRWEWILVSGSSYCTLLGRNSFWGIEERDRHALAWRFPTVQLRIGYSSNGESFSIMFTCGKWWTSLYIIFQSF